MRSGWISECESCDCEPSSLLKPTASSEVPCLPVRPPGLTRQLNPTEQGAELGVLQGSSTIVGLMSEVFNGSLHALLATSMFSEPSESSILKLPLDLPSDGVYGHRSVARRTRCVPVMRSRYVRILPAVLGFSISSLCLVACGGSSASTSTTATSSPATKAIVTAWLAAQKAFHDAALTSDANSPELIAAMIPPQLDFGLERISRRSPHMDIEREGLTYYGSPQFGSIWVEIVRMSLVRPRRRDRVQCEDGEAAFWCCWADHRMS